MTLAYVDQGYTGTTLAEAAKAHGIVRHVVRTPEAKRGFVLLPRRWVVERSFAWAARFRRPAQHRCRTALRCLRYADACQSNRIDAPIEVKRRFALCGWPWGCGRDIRRSHERRSA